MANKNPWQARLKRHAKRTQGSIDVLCCHAWGVLIISLEDVATTDPEARRKAIKAHGAVAAGSAGWRHGITSQKSLSSVARSPLASGIKSVTRSQAATQDYRTCIAS